MKKIQNVPSMALKQSQRQWSKKSLEEQAASIKKRKAAKQKG